MFLYYIAQVRRGSFLQIYISYSGACDFWKWMSSADSIGGYQKRRQKNLISQFTALWDVGKKRGRKETNNNDEKNRVSVPVNRISLIKFSMPTALCSAANFLCPKY